MRIGYACLTVGVPYTDFKSCVLKNVSDERLTGVIAHNLDAFEVIVDYNIDNGIHLFRISSDLIPFGSSPVNTLSWWDLFDNRLKAIGRKIKESGMRVSMHPGQYTVINSPHIDVVSRALDDLAYHTRFMDTLGTDPTNKIILHIGGVYGDKRTAAERFIQTYRDLDATIKQRLVIENDDKSYHIGDVLELGAKLGIPVVYDNLHNTVNSCDRSRSDAFWIDNCAQTWHEQDGTQKIHYAQQDPLKQAGSHAATISIEPFMEFYSSLGASQPDIMLEVKDKNLSAVKCINCTAENKKIKTLELEWSRYKYTVLERAPEAYRQIRILLRNKSDYPAVPFYNLLQTALAQEASRGSSVNAALHVWGYFKGKASEKEKIGFLKRIEGLKTGTITSGTLKHLLWKMAVTYQQNYLLDSYYFML